MAEFDLFFSVWNARSHVLPGAAIDITVGAAKTRPVTHLERTQTGVRVKTGDTVKLAFKKAGLWPVMLELAVTATGIRRTSAPDIRSVVQAHGGQNARTFTAGAWLTLFRDAWPKASAAPHNWSPIPSWTHNLFVFSGIPVLSGAAGATGWGRMRGQLVANQGGAGLGTMFLFEAPDDAALPRLVAAFKPQGVDLKSPMRAHTFFCPKTSGKKGAYPFASDFKAVFNNYLVGGGKRLLNQHMAKKDDAWFVMPMPPPATYFGGIDKGKDLKRYLEEIHFAAGVQETKRIFTEVKLGPCALSGFSAAGTPLHSVMASSIKTEFTKLREIYALDVIPNMVTKLATTAKKWMWGNRKLRIYVGRYVKNFKSFTPEFVKAAPMKSDGAVDRSDARGTFLVVPKSFWEKLGAEQAGATPNPGYFKIQGGKVTGLNVHQLIPQVMATHALATSGF